MDPKLLAALLADPATKAAILAALGPAAAAPALDPGKPVEVPYYVAHKCRGCGMVTRAIVSADPDVAPPVHAGPRDDLPAGTAPGARVDAPPPALVAAPALPSAPAAAGSVTRADVAKLSNAQIAASGLRSAAEVAALPAE